MDNQNNAIALELEGLLLSPLQGALMPIGITEGLAIRIIEALRTPAPAPVGGKPVAWQRRLQYSDVPGANPPWEQCSKKEATGHFEKRPGYEYRPLYAALQAQPTASTAQPDDLERLLGRITCTAETSARVMRDAKNTGGWWGAENTAKNFDIIAKQTDDLRAALAALQAQPAQAQGDDAVERVAFAIIEGSAGTRAAEHAKEFQTANWSDACRSASSALAAMQQAPVADDVRGVVA